MLERMRQTLPDVVWLRDSKQKKALIRPVWRRDSAPRGVCFYAPQFYGHDSPLPWLCGEAVDWLEAAPMAVPPVISRVEPDEGRFFDIHGEILRGIDEGRFQKVVPFAG